MKNYKVVYENETSAVSPLEAVKDCLDTLKTEGSGGRCFTVYDGAGNVFSVDLDEENGNEILPG